MIKLFKHIRKYLLIRNKTVLSLLLKPKSNINETLNQIQVDNTYII